MQAFRLAVRFAESELGFLARARGITITFLGGHDLFSLETVARCACRLSPGASLFALDSGRRARVAEDHTCIPLPPTQLRPVHQRLPERCAERRLIQRQDVRRQRYCALSRNADALARASFRNDLSLAVSC